MKVRFWGVRGSIPCPGPLTRKYGGNSACIELRMGGDERLVIIDAGSGIRELGNYLMEHVLPAGPIRTDLFLSHTHWDHIMGFPFFSPIYDPDTRLRVYGPATFGGEPLAEVVGGQMNYRNFPANMGEMVSAIEYVQIEGEPCMDLGGGLLLTTKILNHPVTTLGYRFHYAGKSVCTCYDTEPFRNLSVTDPAHPDYDGELAEAGREAAAAGNLAIERFFAGVDLLIHDSQYTAQEYEGRKNWGHSTFEHAIAAANRAGVKKLALFHHDPDRTDSQIDAMAEVYCRPGIYGDTEIFFAREGMEVQI